MLHVGDSQAQLFRDKKVSRILLKCRIVFSMRPKVHYHTSVVSRRDFFQDTASVYLSESDKKRLKRFGCRLARVLKTNFQIN